MHNDHKNALPYGTWPSEITSDLIVSDSVSIDEPRMADETIYYIERRPQESGRCVLVRAESDQPIEIEDSVTACIIKTDMIPEPYSVRSRVHEYGGGSYCLGDDLGGDRSSDLGDKNIYFVNDDDQDIYSITGGHIARLTNKADSRFADLVYDPNHHRLITVCETHNQGEVINSIISVDIDSGAMRTLLEGQDFYASPRLNRSADRLCWQSWNHPDMPWDGNELWSSTIDEKGDLLDPIHVAGSNRVSIFQPQWSPDDLLYYVSDESGWWQLYRQPEISAPHQAEQLTFGKKEFAQPQWVFAQSNYTFVDSTTIICHFQSRGESALAKLSLQGKPELSLFSTPWQEFNAITSPSGSRRNHVDHDATSKESSICFIAASGHTFPQLVSAKLVGDNNDDLSITIVKETCLLTVDSENLSQPETIVFTNRHQQPVYANYYPPVNAEYRSTVNEKPPLIVICHGGPTGQSGIALDPRKQFWTSRGFALLDVNYSGSTGYGRDYRSRLEGRWGQLDVEDCCDAAEYVVEQGLADQRKLIIRGSSAGGYTVLAALTFHDVFSAGASYYGISELCSLASDTHKFEARYLDKLVGAYPEQVEIYRQRSPINHSERLNCPVIFFQGKEDRVVPMSQAEKMFEALDRKGVTVAAQYFEGEQHGFRKASTITQSLENELSFYRLIFGLKDKSEISFTGEIALRNS